MKIRISEIFSSMQGEGRFTGMPTLFVRFFGCNLRCDGFGQNDPTDESSFVLPYKELDIKLYKKMTDLPVFSYGCDSSYSWESKFKNLSKDYTEQQLVDELFALGKQSFDIDLSSKEVTKWFWCHPVTGTLAQLCFTGGEPMLQQRAMNYICRELGDRDACPSQITIETNATKPICELDIKLLTHHLHLSCSPKLYSVSGEKKGINYDVIEQYYDYADSGALKFVHNGTQKAWDELDDIVSNLNFMIGDKNWTFWVMPVGSTQESQDTEYLGNLATESMRRGFNISHRVHISVFGNRIGT